MDKLSWRGGGVKISMPSLSLATGTLSGGLVTAAVT